MAQTAPTLADALPQAPSTASPSTFASLADAFVAAQVIFRTQVNDLATNVYNNAVDCYNNAVIAQASASSAVAAANASVWVSGTTYAQGAGVYSPLTMHSYRRIIAGAGTTDPSLDPVNWLDLNPNPVSATIYAYNNFGGI